MHFNIILQFRFVLCRNFANLIKNELKIGEVLKFCGEERLFGGSVH